MTEPTSQSVDAAYAQAAAADLTHTRLKNGVLTLTLDLPTTQAEAWQWLTEPGRLQQWSPIVPDRPLVSAGPATSHEKPGDPAVDVTVVEAREPWFLEHLWGPEHLNWQLAPSGSATQLNLVQELADESTAADMAAGWHMCLVVLVRQLSGEQTARCVGSDALAHGWPQLRERYQQQFDEQQAARQG